MFIHPDQLSDALRSIKPRYSFIKFSSLGVYVMGLTDEDFGKYVCVAENDFGSVNESLEIFGMCDKLYS